MEREFTVGIFRDPEVGCVAKAAAAPGLSGTGHTPGAAATDLLSRFLAPFDDMPHPPTPEAELVCVQRVTVSFSSFSDP
jgi:hypothetical protein